MTNATSFRHVILGAPFALLLACSGDIGGDASGTGSNAEDMPRQVASGTQTSQGTHGGPSVTPPRGGGSGGSASPSDGSMRSWRPQAKGLWIWTLAYTGMTAAEAADRAKSLGVGYVLIKSGQDSAFWPQRLNASVVQEFTSRGMRVLAWPYVTPSGGSAAVTAAAEAAKVPGVDGVVLDVEIEWEQSGNSAAAAKTLCDGIRAQAPGVWLGYTSFGWAAQHPAFPWATFDAHCGDGAFPQVYFSDRGVSWDGPKGLPQAVADYKDLGLKAPMWPIGSNDDVYGTGASPTAAALNAFLAAAGPYASMWEFPSASRPDKLTELAQLDWKNP